MCFFSRAFFALSWLCLFAFTAYGQTLPAPSALRSERFGAINWNVDYAAYPQGQANAPDRLNWGADAVAALGTRVVGAYLGMYNIYSVIPPNVTDLASLAQAPAYDKLFRDPHFKTYALWTYSRGAADNNWFDGFSAAEYAAERDEMRKLGEYLLTNNALAGKSFILFNWEAEAAILVHADKDVTWQAMREWHRARVEGVRLAQQRYPNSPVKVYSGLQYTQVRSFKTGQLCGTPVTDPVNNDPLLNRCAIDFFGADLPFDYYGFSAWDTVNQKFENPAFDLKTAIRNDFEHWLNFVRRKRPEVTSNNFMLLEYGFERVRYGECVAADFLDEMIAALEGPGSFPVAYALWWQAIDNAPHFGYGVGDQYFGFYRTRNGQLNLSLAGQLFQKRLANQTVMRVTGCPFIRKPPALSGILDLLSGTPDFHLNPNSILDIYTEGCCTNPTNPFSASGNKVQIDQRLARFVLPRDNAMSFSESPTRLNAKLPDATRPDETRVWMTDAQGRDSNAYVIGIRCDNCPRIHRNCGLVEAEYQTYQLEQGETLAINGVRFAPSNNTVVIEQQSLTQSVTRFTVPRANFISESTTLIKVVLPAAIEPGYVAVSVIDPQGRASNPVSAVVESRCTECTPRIVPCNGIVSRNAAGIADLFYAGDLFEIKGRLPSTGNKIIVEQTDRNYRTYRYMLVSGSSGWREDARSLTARLPISLFPGRALLYIEDAQGRASRAYAITVAARSVTSVSAANYRGPDVARESIVAAFGVALAPVTQAADSNPLPTELNGVRVVVKDSANVEREAPLFFISPTQVNYQVPPGTALGAATVTFFNGYGSSASGMLNIVSVAPGIFTANADGHGVPAAIIVRAKADGSQVMDNVAAFDRTQNRWVALPIDLGLTNEQVFLVLFGTGWRGRTGAAVATIGGVNCEVTYAATQGALVGLDQANIRIPRSLVGRGNATVLFSANGVAANSVEVILR